MGLTFFRSHTFGKNETNGRWHRHMKGKLQAGEKTAVLVEGPNQEDK